MSGRKNDLGRSGERAAARGDARTDLDAEPAPEVEHVDRHARALARGRGASTLNPGNRFEGLRLHVLGEHLDAEHAEHPEGVQVRTQAFADSTRRIINRVADSPDIPFDWSINPYRGCEHGCVYCYARPTHEALGFSCGLDFESKIVVKHDAPELLRRELASPKWNGEPITLSGVTDPYQPLERRLRITRRLLEICAECRQPVSIITKSRLVTRDLDVLGELARHGAASVAVSVTTLDASLARSMEPRASRPEDRLRAIRELRDAGVPAHVMVAPVVPGLTDEEMPAILKAAAEAGARSAGWVLLRLPHQLRQLFLDWLAREVPERAAKIESRLREMRGGELYRSRFGERQRGRGEHAEVLRAIFQLHAKRHGLDRPHPKLSSASFRRPALDGQLPLFGD